MLGALLQLSTAEMFADAEPKIYRPHCAKSVWVQTTTFHLQHNRSLAISFRTASLTESTVQRVRNLTVFMSCSPKQKQRLETRRMDAEKRAFRARLPPLLTFSTHYQTGWK